MKNKFIIGLALSLFGLLFAVAYLSYKNNSLKTDNTRLTSNETTLNQDLKKWKTKDSTNVATIAALSYTRTEIKDFNPELIQTVKSLGLQLKNVQSILESRTITSTKIKTSIRDSIIYKDTVKCFNYEDKYTKLSGCFTGDSIGIEIKNYDKLTTVINKIPKHKFLWWSWGVKAINVNIVSDNPNTTFDYMKYIELN